MSFRRQRYLSFIFTFFVERWIAAVPTCAASLVDKVGLIHPHKRTRALRLNPVMKTQFLQVLGLQPFSFPLQPSVKVKDKGCKGFVKAL